jgi:hypothetical protein
MRSNEIWIYRFVIIIIALVFSTSVAKAQTPQPSPVPSPTPTLERQFFKNILRDQKAIWTSPFHLEASDSRWLVPLGIGTGALIATDRTTAKWVAKFDDQIDASRVISYAGSTYGAAAVGAAFYFAGRAGNNPRAERPACSVGKHCLTANWSCFHSKQLPGASGRFRFIAAISFTAAPRSVGSRNPRVVGCDGRCQ